MLDFLVKAMMPLFLLVPRLLGLRLLREETLGALSTHDELARRAASGDPASRALLAQFGPTVATILGGDAGALPPPHGPAGGTEAPASLEATTPFALGATASGTEAPPVSAADRKRRGRPAKAQPVAESPSNGEGHDIELAPSTDNVLP